MPALVGFLLLVAQDDILATCKTFESNYRKQNYDQSMTYIYALSDSGKPEAVEALMNGYACVAEHSVTLWKEKERLFDKMQSLKWRVDDKTGKRSGPYEEWFKAQTESDAVETQLGTLRSLQKEIVGGIERMKTPESTTTMLARFKKEKDWRLRCCLAALLAGRQDPAINALLIEKLVAETEPTVRVAMLDALCARGGAPHDESAVESIVTLLKDPAQPWQVRQRAATLIRVWNLRPRAKDIIDALNESEGRLMYELNDVLKAMIGVDKYANKRAWQAWWERYGADWASGKARVGEGGAGDPLATASFYNIPIKSNRVVFILDRSGSMAEDSNWKEIVETGGKDDGIRIEGKRKIDIARYNVKKTLRMLLKRSEEEQVDVFFNVITYNHAVSTWSPKMEILNDSSIKRADSFIDGIQPTGMTNIHDALEAGLTFGVAGAHPRIATGGKAEADTIFLLSDGLPTAGQVTEPGLIRHKFKERNQITQIRVNTVYVGLLSNPTDVPGAGFMQELANDHGGAYASPDSPYVKK